jgi:hypothetical protein
VVEPENGSQLAIAIVKLADDPASRFELGRRARSFAEANFERDAVLGNMFRPLESQVSDVANNIAA